MLDGVGGGVGFFGGELGPGEGEAADGGGNTKGARHLGESHAFEVLVVEGFEETLDSGEEFLGGLPFLLAKGVEAGGPSGVVETVMIGLGASLVIEEPGVERLNAFGPVEAAGPAFEGGERDIEGIRDGLKGAGKAELKVSDEGAESARGFGCEARERSGWAESGCLRR